MKSINRTSKTRQSSQSRTVKRKTSNGKTARRKKSKGRVSRNIGIIMIALCIFTWGYSVYSQVESEEAIKISQEKETEEILITEEEKEYDRIQKLIENDKDDTTILVNKEIALEPGYKPKDLVSTNVQKTKAEIFLRSDVSLALEEMLNAAKEDNIDLYLLSGYRSSANQEVLYNWSLKTYGQDYADKYRAKPNHSEHQTGLAVDLTCKSVDKKLSKRFADTLEGKWLEKNAHKYGFILRYKEGREADTGYAFEPWHFRYIGIDIATYIYENDLILEDLYK